MSNKERLDARNEQIKRITQTLARKQVSPTDMLQARVDSNNSCAYLFYNYAGTDLSFIKGLDTSNVTSMLGMFSGASSLTSLDLRSFNTSNVVGMDEMFQRCKKLTSLDLSSFDTSKVIYMNSMFFGCEVLTDLDLSNFNTEKVLNTQSMFRDCKELTELDLSNFNTSKVTNMSYMFYYCYNLPTLDLSNFNTEKVTDMDYMFSNCYDLTSLDLSNWDTSALTKMSHMFYNCNSLTTLDLSSFDTSKVTNMDYVFSSDVKLTNILGNLNLINAANVNGMFSGCTALTDVTLLNIKKAIALGSGSAWGYNMSNKTIINTIQELWDLTGSTSRTLHLSTTSKENIANIYVKLIDVTDEMLATDPYAANKKPCVVCESTDEGAMTITEYLISKNWSLA